MCDLKNVSKKYVTIFWSDYFFFYYCSLKTTTGNVEKHFDILAILKKAILNAFSFGLSNPVSFLFVTIEDRNFKTVSTQEQVWRWRNR